MPTRPVAHAERLSQMSLLAASVRRFEEGLVNLLVRSGHVHLVDAVVVFYYDHDDRAHLLE